MVSSFIAKINESNVMQKHSRRCFGMEILLQPIVCLSTHEIFGYEVLSRVTQGDGEVLNSESFFTTVDNEIVRYLVLHQILFLEKLDAIVDGETFSVNMPLSFLIDSFLVRKIIHLATKAKIRLALEITSIDMDVTSPALHHYIQLLKQAHIQLWLDDYIQESVKQNMSLGVIHWDMIKIDKSIIRRSPCLNQVIEKLSCYAGCGLIMEGVEDSTVSLQENNISLFAQGYYFGTPVDVIEYVAKWKEK